MVACTVGPRSRGAPRGLLFLLCIAFCVGASTIVTPATAMRYFMTKSPTKPVVAAARRLRLATAHLSHYKATLHLHAIDEAQLLDEQAEEIFRQHADAVLVGEFNATQHQIGWATMKIVTNGAFTDEDQAYAAGRFEGQMSSKMVWNHWNNNYKESPVSPRVNEFLSNNMMWLREQATLRGSAEWYWHHVGLMIKQFDGLRDGVNDAALPGENFTTVQLLQLTAMGDVFDLSDALADEAVQRHNIRNMTRQQFEDWFMDNTYCSALFKVTEDLSDIFFGHTSWYRYNTMLRIFKQVTLNYADPYIHGKTVSYSSYPGMLSSFDDFYLTSHGLAVIETSVSVMNSSMFDGNIREDTVPYWVRVMVSTRSATEGQMWVETMERFNSGTYNNQWMVLNLNLFTPGQPLQPGTLWVAEQLPGIVKSKDVTDILSYGYYPSYNIPMDPELFQMAGYAEATEAHGPAMSSYQMSVRARIFRRDQGKVKDIESFKYMLRYNRFESDPISQGNAGYAIAARRDFNIESPSCGGSLDTKVSSYSLWKSGQTILAQCGPTQQQPMFAFDTVSPKVSCGLHEGVPNMFNFTWQTMKP